MSRFADRVFARWKWLLSLRKKDWTLTDYPVRVRRQVPEEKSPFQPPRFSLLAWRASVLGLWMTGMGETKEEALSELEKHFEAWKSKRLERSEPMIRPGTEAPAEFASSERVDAHAELAQDFIERVLEHEWAFISDESSLWDFHTERSNDALVTKIREVYGVDVADVESGRIAPILERIASERIR